MTTNPHHPLCEWQFEQGAIWEQSCTCGLTAPRPWWSEVPWGWQFNMGNRKTVTLEKMISLLPEDRRKLVEDRVMQLIKEEMNKAISDIPAELQTHCIHCGKPSTIVLCDDCNPRPVVRKKE